MAKTAARKEETKLWRLPELGNAELMRATYLTQTFPRHTHDGFAVGVIERGALGFYYRGENVVAPAGAINLANPDEVHTGHAATEAGWTYRMFYFDAEVLRKAACEIAGRPRNIPFFQTGVIHDAYLTGIIHALHESLEEGKITRLEMESRFLWMLAQLITRHADASPAARDPGRERGRVRLVREYIQENYSDNISLNQLASVANLSPFHLVRVFRDEVGLPPHAYHTQVRINKAKAFLGKGWHIAPTAYETGFVDQSHFSRCFKRIIGVTPGQYSKIVQDL
jgi:AraC-like DNA-binding protein